MPIATHEVERSGRVMLWMVAVAAAGCGRGAPRPTEAPVPDVASGARDVVADAAVAAAVDGGATSPGGDSGFMQCVANAHVAAVAVPSSSVRVR